MFTPFLKDLRKTGSDAGSFIKVGGIVKKTEEEEEGRSSNRSNRPELALIVRSMSR
jgi:hypothetical protein